MFAELTILCPECGAMNTVNIDPSTHVQTAFCEECGVELNLILKRKRPASFAPP
jgi:transcription elongation factor Elf1